MCVCRTHTTHTLLCATHIAGVEALDCYCVDNALARLGDPTFVGYCHSQGAEVGLSMCT